MIPRNDRPRIDAREKPGGESSTQTLSLPDDPDKLALFLDIDGTLLEIAERPELVRVPPDLLGCLKSLAASLNGALALITGRTLDDADSLFAGLSFPVGAVHGLVRRTYKGRVETTGSQESLNGLRSDLAGFAQKRPGLLLEDKARTVALHYRAVPEMEDDIRGFIDTCLLARGGYTVLHGKMVFEIKPEGADKGTAIRAFMLEYPFAGRIPVFLGDDTTDEYGFAAVQKLGGFGVFVGRDPDTAALGRLEGVDAVHAWLRALRVKLERKDRRLDG
ncbi:MAG: trehalose-phosphatase [Alphaproteobacteria bacterium]